MNLTQVPEIVPRPETHYVYVEKLGPFQNAAPQAWKDMHQLVPKISENNKITGYTSLYKVPDGLEYAKFQGGKYCRFVLTGPYADLPAASGRVFELIAERKIPVRDDFFIENYVNDPRTTPEQELLTEILVSTV